MSWINPHKLGVHKILKHIPLNAIFDMPSKRRLAKAVNIADLRLCAKARAHKVSTIQLLCGVEWSGVEWSGVDWGGVQCSAVQCSGICVQE